MEEKFNYKIPLQIGLMTYGAVVVLGLMSYFFYKAIFMSMFLSGVMSVFSISLVLMLAIWSGITYRGMNRNVISFSHAFLAVYIVFAFFALGNVFSQVLVNKLIDKDFPRKIYDITVQKTKMEMDKKNIPDEEQKVELDKMKPQDFEQSYADMGKALVYLLGGTALFSLLVAMFIKRSSEDLIRMNQKNTIQG